MNNNTDDDDGGDIVLRSIPYAMGRLGCSRTKIYELVKDGRLELRKFDRSSRITDRSLRKLLADIMQDKAS